MELEILSRDSSARFRASSKQRSRQRGAVLGSFELGSDHLSNVNTCAYEPSAFRELRLALTHLFENSPSITPSQSQIRGNKKFCFANPLHRDKISACDNITICSGSCLRTVMTVPIAPAQERYRCLVHRRDSICAQTVLDSHC